MYHKACYIRRDHFHIHFVVEIYGLLRERVINSVEKQSTNGGGDEVAFTYFTFTRHRDSIERPLHLNGAQRLACVGLGAATS